MRGIGRVILALGMVAASIAPALASPEGEWLLSTGDTRFHIELCGDGTQLCGTLSWLSDDDYNKRYVQYLNKPAITQIKQVRANRWKGGMRLFGQKFSGTITQTSEDQMTLSGCAFVVVCKTYQLTRYSE